jgi:FHA domain/Double zinc ribbon
MIVCPNCNHQNPDGALQCEACYTPLPATTSCPSCSAKVQADASFCGQCGFNLRQSPPSPASTPVPSVTADVPDLPPLDPLVLPDPLTEAILPEQTLPELPDLSPEISPAESPDISTILPEISPAESAILPEILPEIPPEISVAAPPGSVSPSPVTQLQRNIARLLHVQTGALIELPSNLSVVRIGKPNDRVPPDIDVSGFTDSEVVSRVHASIRIEGDIYYIEDVGSSNGTYVNNMPLPYGNRHRLRPGDRIALGKGDKVSFIFQLA